jgi:aminoglycoside phosphotransferase family enzyme
MLKACLISIIIWAMKNIYLVRGKIHLFNCLEISSLFIHILTTTLFMNKELMSCNF